MAFQNLFGDTLIDNKGNKFAVDDLSKSVAIGLYFSAHWCGPCRQFTPQLAKAYPELKKKGFEVVFVSSDRDEHAFKEYHGSMPWLALPFDKRDLKAKLSTKYKVQGIPTLVILDAKGKLITKDGRSAISSDPQGANFPWTPKGFSEAIGNSFIDNKGGKHTFAEMKDKVIGLYFSAHWCPPCKAFTPVLAKTYQQLQADGKNFEVVFVSSDSNDEEFKEYHGSMPWLAVPYEDDARKGDLSSLYEIQGIPALVLVDGATGKMINRSGRGAVSSDPQGKNFPWHAKLVDDLSAATASVISEGPVLIVFAGKEDASKAEQALTAVAKKQSESKAAAGSDGGDEEEPTAVKFLIAKQDAIVDRVKQLVSYEDGAAVAIILDLPAEAVYYSAMKTVNDVTEAAAQEFVSNFKAGLVDKLPLSDK